MSELKQSFSGIIRLKATENSGCILQLPGFPVSAESILVLTKISILNLHTWYRESTS